MTLRLTETEQEARRARADAEGISMQEAARRAVVFLEINGVKISKASNDDVDDLVIDIAAGQPTIEAIAKRLSQLAA